MSSGLPPHLSRLSPPWARLPLLGAGFGRAVPGFAVLVQAQRGPQASGGRLILLGLGLRALLARARGLPPRPGGPPKPAGLSDKAGEQRQPAPPHEDGAWLEAAGGAAGVGAWAWDLQADTLRWSAEQYRLHGLDPAGPGGDGLEAPARWRATIDPADLPGLDAALAEARRGGRAEAEYRVAGPGSGDAPRWLACRAALERDAQGRPYRLVGACLDITGRRAHEEGLEKQLRLKGLVAAEVHHRVKNSLQLMHGVLLMQARTAGPEAATGLREAAGRVMTIAAVHRRLYEEEDVQGGADLSAYLAGLVEDLHGSLAAGGRDAATILLRAEPGLRLAADELAPLGLVATELVTNALKYGAAPVVVSCRREAEGMRLVVEDAGPGFPPDFEPARSRGLGMRLSVALARHRRGRLEIDRAAPGGRVVLTLPAAPGGPSS